MEILRGRRSVRGNLARGERRFQLQMKTGAGRKVHVFELEAKPPRSQSRWRRSLCELVVVCVAQRESHGASLAWFAVCVEEHLDGREALATRHELDLLRPVAQIHETAGQSCI